MVPSSFLLNPNRLNFLWKKVVLSSCFAFWKDSWILSDRSSWVKTKECAFQLLSYFEDLMSNSRPKNFARTFRDGNKVFILQIALNAHGSFLMISELLHGRRKSLIIVPEGKLGSGWRGFGFHLRKAIAPDSLGIKPPSQFALLPSLPKFRTHKSFLLVVVDGDRKSTSGSRTGKLALPNIQNSIKSNLAIKSSLSSQKLQNLDLHDRGAG